MRKIRLHIGLGGRLVILAVMLFASSTLFSFVVADRLAEDIWKRLGINRQDGMEKIRSSFIDGYLHHYGLSNVKNLAANDRAAAAKDLLDFSRQYLSGPVFKAEYEKARTAAHPAEPVENTRTKEQIRDNQIAELKKSIQSMESLAKTLPADQRKDYQNSIDEFKNMIKEYQDPKNTTIEMIYQQEVATNKGALDRYKADLKHWETEYPADSKQFVKARMQHYLSVAATVDFSAQLTEQFGKKRFVNPAYQSKNNEWKLIYRAGKDVYEQTRVFIEQWMKEL
ncbi:MAG: hypothetical protein BGO55_24880 [Sphingobacteriales bacterium 50-39]|nr:hypothetical protein [Sphingobacteriales bacterium]OJW58521.1 MAG: hypothetical protein BGO55_24880 [Sphingobacteriales bacterium 50-39]